MSGVEIVTVKPADADQRLDKWFKQHYPGLSFGRLQKLLRKGEVRIDGKRCKDGKTRVLEGQEIRVPPLQAEKTADPVARPSRPTSFRPEDKAFIESLILYQDDAVMVINKPAGLAVQGGSGTKRHVDGMLGAFEKDGERPRLVHRLDRDTSGVLVLAKTRKAAASLTAAFKSKTVRKVYWACVVGTPDLSEGRIDLPLAKLPGKAGERMVVDEDEGKRAVTEFITIEQLAKRAAWLELEPVTGRTHQLRVHLEAIGTPILGDGKYGGEDAFLSGAEVAKQLHLHARAVKFPHPDTGHEIIVKAPLPDHMKATWDYLGFDESAAPEPFGEGSVCFVCQL